MSQRRVGGEVGGREVEGIGEEETESQIEELSKWDLLETSDELISSKIGVLYH